MMRLTVEILHDDSQNRDFKKGEQGKVDGYVRGGDGIPYACVWIKNRIVLVPLTALEVIC